MSNTKVVALTQNGYSGDCKICGCHKPEGVCSTVAKMKDLDTAAFEDLKKQGHDPVLVEGSYFFQIRVQEEEEWNKEQERLRVKKEADKKPDSSNLLSPTASYSSSVKPIVDTNMTIATLLNMRGFAASSVSSVSASLATSHLYEAPGGLKEKLVTHLSSSLDPADTYTLDLVSLPASMYHIDDYSQFVVHFTTPGGVGDVRWYFFTEVVKGELMLVVSRIRFGILSKWFFQL